MGEPSAKAAGNAPTVNYPPRPIPFMWSAGFHGYRTIGEPDADYLAGKAERDRLSALGIETETWC